jgi:hypothetical protein
VSRKLNARQLEGRLKNAVAETLEKRLSVPKIFIESKWPNPHRRTDVLAIDHAGAGDIHCVEIKPTLESAYAILPMLMTLPAHFKYVAVWEESGMPSVGERVDEIRFYAPDGLGRVGVMAATEGPDKRVHLKIVLSPERFRIGTKYYQSIDRFLKSHVPDLEIRE